MNEDRRRILDMLAQGKINAAEAEQLIDAIGRSEVSETKLGAPTKAPKYLRVLVEGDSSEHGGRVNVRIPLNLIRAGVKLAALLPSGVNDQVNLALKQNGIYFDISKLKPENIEELIQQLDELTVDVEGNRGEKVRVFCE